MPAPLTQRQRDVLSAALAHGGLHRGRSGYYPAASSYGPPLPFATVRALQRLSLLERPDPTRSHLAITDAGRAALSFRPALAPAVPPRAYKD